MRSIQITSDYKIRRLRPLDILDVYRIGIRCFHEGSFTYKRFLKHYLKGRQSSFVVCKKKTVVGFIVAFMREDGGYINYVGVAKEFRRRGLGRAMVEYMQNIFKASNAPRVSLHVRTTAGPAVALYQKLGYVIDATREDFYSDGESAYVMCLWLPHSNSQISANRTSA